FDHRPDRCQTRPAWGSSTARPRPGEVGERTGPTILTAGGRSRSPFEPGFVCRLARRARGAGPSRGAWPLGAGWRARRLPSPHTRKAWRQSARDDGIANSQALTACSTFAQQNIGNPGSGDTDGGADIWAGFLGATLFNTIAPPNNPQFARVSCESETGV